MSAAETNTAAIILIKDFIHKDAGELRGSPKSNLVFY
jgi:hypothetical protein